MASASSTVERNAGQSRPFSGDRFEAVEIGGTKTSATWLDAAFRVHHRRSVYGGGDSPCPGGRGLAS